MKINFVNLKIVILLSFMCFVNLLFSQRDSIKQSKCYISVQTGYSNCNKNLNGIFVSPKFSVPVFSFLDAFVDGHYSNTFRFSHNNKYLNHVNHRSILTGISCNYYVLRNLNISLSPCIGFSLMDEQYQDMYTMVLIHIAGIQSNVMVRLRKNLNIGATYSLYKDRIFRKSFSRQLYNIGICLSSKI